MKKVKVLAFLTTASIFLSLFAGTSGCAKKADSGAVKTITIETSDTFNPDGFKNANGQPDGFEIEVAKAIAKTTTKYKFKYIAVPFDDLFTNLASGKADVIALEQYPTAQTKDKYLYTSVAYSTLVARFITLASSNKINSWADAQGKTVLVVPGDEYTILTKYNNEHKDNPIKLKVEADPATCVKDLVDGRADAFCRGEVAIKTYGDTYGVKLKGVAKPIHSNPCYFVLRKGETDVKSVLDAGVTKIKADGTLKKLHIKWHGKDYTPPYTGDYPTD